MEENFYLKMEKENEWRGKKYAFSRSRKEKDLVYQNDKQGLKLCDFISNETLNVFVPKRAI